MHFGINNSKLQPDAWAWQRSESGQRLVCNIKGTTDGNREMASLRGKALQSFDNLFNRFFAGRSIAVRNLAGNPAPATWRIPLDVVQNKDELVVTASVPGTAKEDIEISVYDTS